LEIEKVDFSDKKPDFKNSVSNHLAQSPCNGDYENIVEKEVQRKLSVKQMENDLSSDGIKFKSEYNGHTNGETLQITSLEQQIINQVRLYSHFLSLLCASH
jgi:hypothetical protein